MIRPKILVASSNRHKLYEIKSIVGKCIEIFYLPDFSLQTPEEYGKTLRENAFIKAKYAFEKTSIPSLGEDTGLFVDALNGAPGVFSSRFAGKGASDRDNREKILYLLRNEDNRRARFITCLCFYDGKKPVFFEGVLEGEISRNERGRFGFGYDPVFIPRGYNITLGEMNPRVKNLISHRFKALKKFLKWFVWVL